MRRLPPIFGQPVNKFLRHLARHHDDPNVVGNGYWALKHVWTHCPEVLKQVSNKVPLPAYFEQLAALVEKWELEG
jgi:hypothetical protein